MVSSDMTFLPLVAAVIVAKFKNREIINLLIYKIQILFYDKIIKTIIHGGLYSVTLWQRIKQMARSLKSEVFTLAEAIKHPAVPWYAKVMAAVVVAYAFSPIDLIPDFIPVLGFLDDIILVPIGIYFTIKLIPPSVLESCRRLAAEKENVKQKNWFAGVFVLLLWILFAVWMYVIVFN